MKCNNCGTINESGSTVCSNCKATLVEQKTNRRDDELMCLIFGITSLFACWLGIILGIIAIVIGNRIKKETGKMPPGMICGILSISIYTLIIIVIGAIYLFSNILGV